MLITHTYFGEVYAPTHWNANWTNISEEAFVMQSWMERAWNHNKALNSHDKTGKVCDPKATNIREELNKLMDKSLLHIFNMFSIAHQYQYNTYYFNNT
jgi:hypothetical protein